MSEPRTFLGASQGVCRECQKSCEVRYVALGDQVFLERNCPTHGVRRALVAESLSWYLEAITKDRGATPPRSALVSGHAACPTACGPCARHAQVCRLPVFSITNACELRCPICFTYNRSDQVYFMGEAEFARHIEFLAEQVGSVDLVNITGGEPTQHPQLVALLRQAKRSGIGRITVNTNGLRLARDPDLAQALAELGVYVVLSLDTLEGSKSELIHGRDIAAEKLQALERLASLRIPTTLLMVLIAGINEDELPRLLELTLAREHVRSLTIQTMTYTGQGGKGFLPRSHVPVDGVVRRLVSASNGLLKEEDFVALPSAHPLCYQVAYLWSGDAARWCSFADVVPASRLQEHLGGGYLLQPSEALEDDLRGAIDRLWSEGERPEVLSALRTMIERLYPADRRCSVHERQRLAESMVKTLYVHAHMDEDTFEVGRAMRCCDQVPVRAERLIGACSYNLFYRQRDERFWVDA